MAMPGSAQRGRVVLVLLVVMVLLLMVLQYCDLFSLSQPLQLWQKGQDVSTQVEQQQQQQQPQQIQQPEEKPSQQGEQPQQQQQQPNTGMPPARNLSLDSPQGHHSYLPQAVVLISPDPAPRDPLKKLVQTNTLRHWASMTRKGICLLILGSENDPAELVMEIKQLSARWPCVRSAPPEQLERTQFGVPLFRSLYMTAEDMFPSASLFLYLNSDIIVSTPQAVDLLDAVHRYAVTMDANGAHIKHPTLATGRRWNVPWSSSWQVHPNNSKTFNFRELQKTYARSTIGGIAAQDYFLMTRGFWDWATFPPLAIGRPAYDNYIVTQACGEKAKTVVEGTHRVFAIHQTDSLGRRAAVAKKPPDLSYNTDVLNNDKTLWRLATFNGATTSSHVLQLCNQTTSTPSPFHLHPRMRTACVVPRNGAKFDVHTQSDFQ